VAEEAKKKFMTGILPVLNHGTRLV